MHEKSFTIEGEPVKVVTRYEHVVEAVFGQPWAILPSVYATICEVVGLRASGSRFTAEEIAERIGAAPVRRGAARNGAIQVLPLYGVLSQRMNMMAAMSGGTSTELFGQAFRQAIADPAISAVVLDIDSPGGAVFGVQELWSLVMAARGRKPIVAVANSMAASAAYWVASAADELVVTPGGEVGSIGVVAGHEDVSQAQDLAGVKTTLVSAGKYKVEGNPFAPLDDEGRAELQRRVDQYYEMFTGAVAKGRGVRASEVRSGFGQGRMVGAEDAVRLGMADRVGTLDGELARLMGSPARGGAGAAMVDEGVINASTDDRVGSGDGDCLLGPGSAEEQAMRLRVRRWGF